MKKYVHILVFVLGCFSGYAQKTDSAFPEFKCGHARTHHMKSAQIIERESYHEYDLIYNNITWSVDPAIRYISGEVTFTFRAKIDQLLSIQLDLFDSLRVDSITQGNKLLQFSHTQHTVTVELNKSVELNDTCSFTVFYQGAPPNTGSGAFETQLRDSVPELWTLSQPYGAMEWWPCKQSLQDKIDSLDITIKVPSAYKSATNGLLIHEEIIGTQNISKWKHRYPITTYLVGIAVTNYVEFSDYFKFSENDSMLLINRVFPEYYEEAKQEATHTPKLMQLYSDLFMPYPFKNEWYGHAQFSRGGGMEHQTMSFMGNLNFELVGHELAHQWFGNYVTLNSWHDTWLNEGFATYLSGIGYEFLNPALWYRWKKVRLDRIVSIPDGSVYVNDTTDVSRVFDGRLTYFKGAYLLLMLRWELGDDVFYKAIQNYLNDTRIAYGFTRQDILVEHFENTADTSLIEFFDDWYYGEGYPIYTVSWHQQNEMLHLEIHQTTSHESVEFYEMHLPFYIISETDTTEIRLKHSYSGQEFQIPFTQKIKDVVYDPEIWMVSTNSVANSAVNILNKNISKVYPNPANENITIEISEEVPSAQFSFYTLSGKLVLTASTHKQKTTINVSDLNTGIYLMLIENYGNTQTVPILIKRE